MSKHVRRLNQAQAAGMAQTTQGRARVVPDKTKYDRKREKRNQALSAADRAGLKVMGEILTDATASDDELIGAAFTILGIVDY